MIVIIFIVILAGKAYYISKVGLYEDLGKDL